MYKLSGMSEGALVRLKCFYEHKKIVLSEYFDPTTGLYEVELSNNAIIKLYSAHITIDLAGVLYTINRNDYVSFTVM